ncbi:MAG: hypothetical protein MJ154_03515 [Candidatus Saccharibacteria bacterium]|nr:hypothetical protein [Candidatus Saccharibacteria bacterium]
MEKDIKLNAKIDGKEVELHIYPDDLEDFLAQCNEIKQKQERERATEITRTAAEIAIKTGYISTGLLQRKMCIGYGRAAVILDELVSMGIIGEAKGGNAPREILVNNTEELDKIFKQSQATHHES